MRSLNQLVVFALAEETYGVDIQQVREIIRVPEVTTVPHTPDFVRGVINLRGGIIPVIDLRRRFGFSQQEATNDTRIVIVELDEQLVGMQVDGVSEVLRVEESDIEPPSPYIVNIDSQFIVGVARLGEQLTILLDLNQILLPEEQRTLEAVIEAGMAPTL